MRELMLIPAGIILELLVFFCAGSLLMRLLRMKAETSMALFMGYLLYFSVFELIAVPMTLKWISLTHFAWFWAAVMVSTVFAGCLFLHRQWFYQLREWGNVLKAHSWMLLLVAAVVLLQCLLVAAYQDNTADAAHYVGEVSTSVYTDTLARYNPLTGVLQKNFNIRYDLSAYPMNNAVWCCLLGIHPIVQSKIVMAVVNVLMINLLFYQLGKKLFREDVKKADLFVVFVCLLQLFSYSLYTSGTFQLTRCYEGKALLANVAIPAAFYAAVCLWMDEKSRNTWVFLVLASVSALTFSGSSIIYPVAVSAAVLPVMLFRRKLSWAIPYALCMVSGFLYAAVYFSSKLGWLVFPAS